MSFSMAGGPYSYNRFSQFNKLVEGAKPDFLDMDKDGNKKESFKKAVKDKEKGVKEGCECDDKKKSKKDMKEYRDPVSYALEADKKLMKLHGGDKKMTSKKKVTKEDVMQHLMDEGFVSNEVSAEVLFNHMSDDWLVSLETAIEEGMHRDAKTGEVVKKAEIGKTYYPNMPKKKTSVAIRKEKG